MNSRTRILLFISLSFLFNCVHSKTEKITSLNDAQKSILYQSVESDIRSSNATELKECNCMKAFFRDLSKNPDHSSRYTFDDLVGRHAEIVSVNKDDVNVLIIGSGTLLNELTAVANILARGKNLNLYLTDWAYIFYDDPEFEQKATAYGKNPDLIPEGWKGFYFWEWYKNEKRPYLPFFRQHHQAIDQFKTVVSKLDTRYGTKTQIRIIQPPVDEKKSLPELDLVFSVDAFIDIPNLIWNFYHQFELNSKSIRYLTLNKSKPLGGFWDSTDLSKKEEYSLKPVSIDIFDIGGNQTQGAYQLIEHIDFEKNENQMIYAPGFKSDPERSATQGLFDMRKQAS